MTAMRTVSRTVRIVAIALIGAGCATQRPVMYPNAHHQAVDQATVDADIDACVRLANIAAAGHNKSGEIATDAAGNAAVGAAAGAAAGAVYGDVGRGAAGGAAAAGAGSLMRGMLQSGQPDSLHKAFVEKCLRDKGYQPIGWK